MNNHEKDTAMSRYLLLILGAIAITACTDNRPQGDNSPNSPSPSASVSDDKGTYSASPQDSRGSSTGPTADTSINRPSRTGPAVSPTLNDAYRSESANGGNPMAISTDRNGKTKSALTAGDQSESESDRTITKLIRQAVVADDTLSVKAKNCTIITTGGVVTLRGTVNTDAERQSIASKADGVIGVHHVENNLLITR
jgi:hyperosmotically inducible protein